MRFVKVTNVDTQMVQSRKAVINLENVAAIDIGTAKHYTDIRKEPIMEGYCLQFTTVNNIEGADLDN